MTRERIIFALCGALCLGAARVHGQTPLGSAQQPPSAGRYVDPEGGLSLEAAVAKAMEQEPSLLAARAELEVARGMRVQAGLRPNPMLSLERREQPAGTDNQTAVGVQWPLDLFRKKARVALADRETEATQQAVADRERLLASEVRSRYGQVAAAVRDLAVAESLEMSGQRDLGLLQARVAEGASAPLERDLMDVELRLLESERLLAEGKADAAMFELKRILGLSSEMPLKLRDNLEALVSMSGAPAGSQVGRTRTDVREAQARVLVAEARIDRARGDGRFDVSLTGSYMRMDAGFPQRGFNAQGALDPVHGVFHYLAGGAMVVVPLRNRNQGEIAAAQAERTAASARLDAAQLTANAEVAAATAQEARARQALAVLAGALKLSRQNLDVVRQTFELGRATATDVLVEQRRYLQVESAHTSRLQAVFDARTALLRAQGETR